MPPQTPFILGINYWPRRKAMYWWSNFDAGEVRDEFAVIHDVGMRLVRIFLLWDDWMPAPDVVNLTALQHLETVAAIAADQGLQLDVTFFTGHMSGPNWAPGWMLERSQPLPPRVRQLVSGGQVVNCGYFNPYVHPVALAAEELLLRSVVGRLKDHPAIGLWNLGNEPDLFARPPSAADGKAWARRLSALIREIDPLHPITCGLHVPSLTEDNGLRVHDIFSEVDVPVMHGYPMYASWSTGPLDPDFVPFLSALTAALAGKPAIMEEFGGCTTGPGQASTVWAWQGYGQPLLQFMASEEDFADYLDHVLTRLVAVGSLGALLWCYADYSTDLWDRPPCDQMKHERFFGLVRPDGSLKPHADVIRRFAASQPLVQAPQHPVVLDLTPEEYYRAPLKHARRLYAAHRRKSGNW